MGSLWFDWLGSQIECNASKESVMSGKQNLYLSMLNVRPYISSIESDMEQFIKGCKIYIC